MPRRREVGRKPGQRSETSKKAKRVDWKAFVKWFNNAPSFWDFSKQRALNDNTVGLLQTALIVFRDEIKEKPWTRGEQSRFSLELISRGGAFFRKMRNSLDKSLNDVISDDNLGTKVKKLSKLVDRVRDSVQANARIVKSYAELLGFVYVNSDSSISLSMVGKAFIKSRNPKTIIRKQMLKYQAANPTEPHRTNLLNPVRFTVAVLNEVGGSLSADELGMFVMPAQSEVALDRTVDLVTAFRSLSPKKRSQVIRALDKKLRKKIERYVPYVVTAFEWLDICKRDTETKGMILVRNRVSRKILQEEFRCYDFSSQVDLWVRYYCNPELAMPPKDVSIEVIDKKTGDVVPGVVVQVEGVKSKERFTVGITSMDGILDIPVPPQAMRVLLTQEDKHLVKKIVDFSASKSEIHFHVVSGRPKKPTPPVDEIGSLVLELAYKHSLDNETIARLDIAGEITGERKQEKTVRGGRLEQLLFMFLRSIAKGQGLERVEWNGSLDRWGLPIHAPPGLPDIVVHKGGNIWAVEATLLGDTRTQWSQEGVSVPSHIRGLKKEAGSAGLFGIFLAPELHEDMVIALKNLDDVNILPLRLEEFLKGVKDIRWEAFLLRKLGDFRLDHKSVMSK